MFSSILEVKPVIIGARGELVGFLSMKWQWTDGPT